LELTHSAGGSEKSRLDQNRNHKARAASVQMMTYQPSEARLMVTFWLQTKSTFSAG